MLGFQPESGWLLGSIAPDFLRKKLEFLDFWMLLFPLEHYSNCTENGTTASGSSFCCGLAVLFLESDNKGRFGKRKRRWDDERSKSHEMLNEAVDSVGWFLKPPWPKQINVGGQKRKTTKK